MARPPGSREARPEDKLVRAIHFPSSIKPAPDGWPAFAGHDSEGLTLSLRLGIALLRCLLERGHAALELGAEVADQALDRPCRGVAERADRMALHFLGHFLEEIDLLGARVAFLHAGEHAPHPAGALAARRALAA